MSKAPSRAEQWPTIYHGSDYATDHASEIRKDTGYVGQVGALNGLTAQLNEDHSALRYSNLAFREPRPTKDGSPLLAPRFSLLN